MEIMINLLVLFFGVVIGGILSGVLLLKVSFKIIDKKNLKIDKFMAYFYLYDKWLDLKERTIKIDNYFKKHNYYKIAIYGMGKVGRHFLYEMKETDIQVLYAIDSKENVKNEIMPVYSLKRELPEVDAIVVTPIFDYDRIYHAIKEVKDIDIISLDDIMYELL